MTALVSADSAADHPTKDRRSELEGIVEGLRSSDFGRFKEAVEAAREYRDEAIPLIADALRKLVADAREDRIENSRLPITGLCLLTELRATEALPVVLELLTLPGELPEELLDDAITEVVPTCLAALAGDRLELLDALIRDVRVNEYARWAAVRVRLFLVRDGRMSRVAAVEALERHLREAIDRSDRPIGAALVSELTALGGREAYRTVSEAFSAGIVDETMIDLAEAEEEFAEASFRQQALDHLPPTGIADCVAELERWDWGADDEPEDASLSEVLLLRPVDLKGNEPLPISPLVDEPIDGTIRNEWHIGRNEACPCGSGKKFKKCCGKPGT